LSGAAIIITRIGHQKRKLTTPLIIL